MKYNLVDWLIILQIDLTDNYSFGIKVDEAVHWSLSHVFSSRFIANKHQPSVVILEILNNGRHAVGLYINIMISYILC